MYRNKVYDSDVIANGVKQFGFLQAGLLRVNPRNDEKNMYNLFLYISLQICYSHIYYSEINNINLL
jgi:hypothetical protein